MDQTLDVPHLPDAVEMDLVRLRMPSRPDWIEPTVDFLKKRAIQCGVCRDNQAGKLVMALHEALVNSVIHGNLEISSDLKDQPDNAFGKMLAARAADPQFAGRPVEIAMEYDGQRCQWALTDQGNGFDHERLLYREPGSEEDLLRLSGRGLMMMRALVDEVRYERGGRRVILTMRKPDCEKRQQPRYPWQAPLQVMPIKEDGSIDWEAASAAVSRNFSPEGMAVLQANLTSAQRVLIGVTWEGHPVYLPAEVRHCRTVAEGVVEIGCRFQTAAKPPVAISNQSSHDIEEAIAGLVERLQTPESVPEDLRRHRRVAYTERIEVQSEGAAETRLAFARNLSKGGIAFIGPVTMAGIVIVALPRPGTTPLRLRAQVMRSVKIMEGFYDIGTRFVEGED